MDSSTFIYVMVIYMANCQDISHSGPLSQSGNPFKSLIGNTGNTLTGMSAYSPGGNMVSMTGYGSNCSPLQGLPVSNARPSSLRYGMSPIQPFMGMTSGCSCTLTVDIRGCFTCPCGGTGTQIPKTGVGTISITKQRERPRSTTAPPSYISTTSSDDQEHISSIVSNKDKVQTLSHISEAQTDGLIVGQVKEQTKTHSNSPGSEIDITSVLFQQLGYSAKIRNLSETVSLRTNFSSLQSKARNVDGVTSEESFPFAVSLGCAFLLSCAVCCVLCYLWYTTRKQIKYQRNELYFVEKSFRQSIASDDDSLKSTDEIIYSLMGKRCPPVLPLRTPPATPTAPPVSTASPSGQTCFNFEQDDVKHDYLELI